MCENQQLLVDSSILAKSSLIDILCKHTSVNSCSYAMRIINHLQKHTYTRVLENSYSENFLNVLRKTHLMETFLLKTYTHKLFIEKHLSQAFSWGNDSIPTIILLILFLEPFVSKLKQKSKCRSSRPEAFCKKGVRKYFTKFTGKLLRLSLFFNKVLKKL